MPNSSKIPTELHEVNNHPLPPTNTFSACPVYSVVSNGVFYDKSARGTVCTEMGGEAGILVYKNVGNHGTHRTYGIRNAQVSN